MELYRKTLLAVMALGFAWGGTPARADECGPVPEAPAVVDGKTATMDELVANSQAVKAFIAAADDWLDCNEAFVQSDAFKKLSTAEQQRRLDLNSRLLDERNAIGDRFNEQVAAWKEAHPE